MDRLLNFIIDILLKENSGITITVLVLLYIITIIILKPGKIPFISTSNSSTNKSSLPVISLASIEIELKQCKNSLDEIIRSIANSDCNSEINSKKIISESEFLIKKIKEIEEEIKYQKINISTLSSLLNDLIKETKQLTKAIYIMSKKLKDNSSE